MLYRYDTHLHTAQASACSAVRGRDYIPFYQDQGYTGIFVTDHFFGGNTAVDRSLPWREQVDRFCSGYEDARNEGDKRGFPVFFGWEQNYQGDEYLVYGLDKAWLYAHPEVKRWPRRAVPRGAAVRRLRGGRPTPSATGLHYLNTACVDGAEVYNVPNAPEMNVRAYHYAKNLGLPMLAGSDIQALSGLRCPASRWKRRCATRQILRRGCAPTRP